MVPSKNWKRSLGQAVEEMVLWVLLQVLGAAAVFERQILMLVEEAGKPLDGVELQTLTHLEIPQRHLPGVRVRLIPMQKMAGRPPRGMLDLELLHLRELQTHIIKMEGKHLLIILGPKHLLIMRTLVLRVLGGGKMQALTDGIGKNQL